MVQCFSSYAPVCSCPEDDTGVAELVIDDPVDHDKGEDVISRHRSSFNANTAKAIEAAKAGLYRALLPECAYHPEVQALAEGSFKDQLVPMTFAVGPGVIWARCALAALWFCFLCMVYIGYRSHYCTSDSTGERMAVVPGCLWLLWWPAFLVCIYVEVKCLRLVSIPYAQVVGQYKVLGIKVPFSCWMLLTLWFSFVQKVDLASDSFSMATMMANPHCRSERFNKVWELRIQSSFEHLKILEQIPFEFFVGVSFVLIFVQVFYAIVVTTPGSCDKHVDYVIAGSGSGVSKPNAFFNNMLGEESNLGDALIVLSEPTGMCTISKMMPSYPEHKAKHVLQCLKTVPYSSAQKEFSDVHRALSFARNALSTAIALIGAVSFCEGAVQINVQVEFFVLRRALSQDTLWQWHWISGISSILLSLVMCIEKAAGAREYIRFSREVIHTIDSMSTDEALDEPQTHWKWLFSDEVRTMRKHERQLVMCVIVLLLSVIYAMTKCVALFVCESGLWSLTGCIAMSDLAHAIQ